MSVMKRSKLNCVQYFTLPKRVIYRILSESWVRRNNNKEENLFIHDCKLRKAENMYFLRIFFGTEEVVLKY